MLPAAGPPAPGSAYRSACSTLSACCISNEGVRGALNCLALSAPSAGGTRWQGATGHLNCEAPPAGTTSFALKRLNCIDGNTSFYRYAFRGAYHLRNTVTSWSKDRAILPHEGKWHINSY